MNQLHDKVQVLVIGSGAGGTTTAVTLAEAGFDVVVLEEGRRVPFTEYGASAVQAMSALYRNNGMTPILGRVPIGYVEGRCLGGSTEINSGLWQRLSPEFAMRWKVQYDLADATPEDLEEHFVWAEQLLKVSKRPSELWPKTTELFKQGAESMGWSVIEIPRAAPGCVNTNACSTGCPTAAKQGMTRALIPLAEHFGARYIPNCKVKLLLKHKDRITGVLAELELDNEIRLVRIDAEHVFLCAGPTQTPAVLRASGIRRCVGDNFRIHPMIKVCAMFDENVDAVKSVLPFVQVKEFWPDITLGGSFFNTAHAAMILSENWPDNENKIQQNGQMANYYVAVKGTGRGCVRNSLLSNASAIIRYDLSNTDLTNLSRGFARLCELLLSAGAKKVFPSIHGISSIDRQIDAVRWLDEPLPLANLALSTVHAFSSCPMGERRDRCAADSYGKVYKYENLYINDASMLPDSPGTNPQGTIMALARRNALHFKAMKS
jgi:choline dehydrogenase-like flavoprotein